MKIVIKLFLVLLLTVSIVSCKKYLDVAPDNIATIDYAFRNRNEAENYLFTCYSVLQKGFNMGDVTLNPGFTTSGEVIYPLIFGNLNFNIIMGTLNVISPVVNWWDGENGGSPLFREIRHCNIFLENVDKPVDLTDPEKKRWIAEAKFLKAYYHFCLVKMYGPIPIIRQNLPISSSAEEVRVKREPVDSAFNYITRLLDEAAVDLPDKIENEVTELGRVTRPIALSIKSEVLTTQASPLYNGNADYANFKNKDGQVLFSATADHQKWKKAADACKAAIDACTKAGISLYKFIPPGNISNISDSTKLLLTLQNAVTDNWNNEIIWGKNIVFPYQHYCVPRLTDMDRVMYIVNSLFAVPIGEAELFYTNNGVPITEDKTWDYANRYNLQTAGIIDKYYIKQGYTTIKMHFNREPRFYADLGFDGGIWFGAGILDDNKALYVQAKYKQLAGVGDETTTNITGYWPKKLVHYQSTFLTLSSVIPYRLPMMRLAALYLLYAETLNEVNGPSEEVYQYVDQIRVRAGLKGVRESWNNYSNTPGKVSSKEGMREIIHRERRIELCFEGQIGWDLRRWKELQGILSKPIEGWDIYQDDAMNYYRARSIFIPVFGIRDYFWPIKDNDLTMNPNLVQNPLW